MSTGKLEPGDDIKIERTRLEFHNLQISDHRYLEKVLKNLRQKLNLPEEAPVLDLKTNVLIRGSFLSTSMKAAVHFGPNYNEIVEVYRNTNFEELKNLFDIILRLILEHEAEMLNVSPNDWTAPSWTRYTLTHDQVMKWTKAKVHVYSDSVLCLGRMQEQKRTNDGMINSKSFDSPLLAENYLALMEHRLSSSGIFPRAYFIGDPPEDPRRSARSKH